MGLRQIFILRVKEDLEVMDWFGCVSWNLNLCTLFKDRCIDILYMRIHHHHVALPVRISLTLSRHFSLSFIASGRSSGLHPVSSHSCCMYVRAGRPALAHPYVGVHRSTSLMSSSLLLQQCPACLVRRTCIVFVMGAKCPYSWSFVGCCRQDLGRIFLNESHIIFFFFFCSGLNVFKYQYLARIVLFARC